QVFNASAIGKISQRFTTLTADANLEVRQLKLFADVRMDSLELVANLQHRGVQPETGFHRNDHQVQSIRQTPRDAKFATRDQTVEDEFGPDESDDQDGDQIN